MFRVFAGAALVIAGIAAFIEGHSHRPVAATTLSTSPRLREAEERIGEVPHAATGLSQTAYDLLRIGAWALVIVGGLLVVTGLMRYWAVQRERAARAGR
jgi:hypothetical protein